MAIYPNGILNWTQRVDGQIVWAADPNSLAAEVAAIEQYIGVSPQKEATPLTGAPSSFTNLSSRVSAAMLQSGHPFVQLSGTGDVYQSNNAQNLQHFGCHHTDYDWDDYVSGGSINIQDSGVWLVHSTLGWPYVSGGWVTHCHFHDNDLMRRSIFDWDRFPSSGSNYYGERYLNQLGLTETTYLGYIPAGTTIGIYVGNMCNENPVTINSASLSAYFLRP